MIWLNQMIFINVNHHQMSPCQSLAISMYFPMKPPSIPWFPPRRNSGSLRPAVACGYAGPYPPWDVEALRGSRSAMKSWWLCTRTTSRTGKEKPQKWNIKKIHVHDVCKQLYTRLRFVCVWLYIYILYTRRRMVLNSFPFIDGIRIYVVIGFQYLT